MPLDKTFYKERAKKLSKMYAGEKAPVEARRGLRTEARISQLSKTDPEAAKQAIEAYAGRRVSEAQAGKDVGRPLGGSLSSRSGNDVRAAARLGPQAGSFPPEVQQAMQSAVPNAIARVRRRLLNQLGLK